MSEVTTMPSKEAKRRRIGRRAFTDGVERDVFEDSDSQQWVDDGGERVDGQWLLLADEPWFGVTRRPANRIARA
jgi:hypothetical protein